MQHEKQSDQRKIVLVCSYCNKILKDKDVWGIDNTGALLNNLSNLSHGICPNCLKENFPNEYLAIEEEKKEKIRNALINEFKEFYGHIAR